MYWVSLQYVITFSRRQKILKIFLHLNKWNSFLLEKNVLNSRLSDEIKPERIIYKLLQNKILMNLLKLSGHLSSGGLQIPGHIQPAQPSWLHSISMTKTFPTPLQGAVKSCSLWLCQLLFCSCQNCGYVQLFWHTAEKLGDLPVNVLSSVGNLPASVHTLLFWSTSTLM